MWPTGAFVDFMAKSGLNMAELGRQNPDFSPTAESLQYYLGIYIYNVVASDEISNIIRVSGTNNMFACIFQTMHQLI